ncbi:DUF6364 family protein [Truepera radiovictrix]|uniref:CopG domain protein DNA-binding domain protein n=1 Tax=Truepera radiovictrix (strain DSM 17093 / CIP 108686 / LMG 22925 / RQ-24) TaxID=649638 RepID=D7CUT0_TRURR|nr:DUF6364 family protein [Truepera radiovictrix]ADI14071.1 conserved hypothetical protein [Truepera radiovictrix DSM 17093]WMT57367.1 hypothetical protein RCV51_00120 [Truepera radiovictrix]
METQNVTLRIPKALLKKAKQVAAERGTSMTALVIESLTRITSGNEAYNAAWERQQALMRSGRKLRHEGEAFASRETLHER